FRRSIALQTGQAPRPTSVDPAVETRSAMAAHGGAEFESLASTCACPTAKSPNTSGADWCTSTPSSVSTGRTDQLTPHPSGPPSTCWMRLSEQPPPRSPSPPTGPTGRPWTWRGANRSTSAQSTPPPFNGLKGRTGRSAKQRAPDTSPNTQPKAPAQAKPPTDPPAAKNTSTTTTGASSRPLGTSAASTTTPISTCAAGHTCWASAATSSPNPGATPSPSANFAPPAEPGDWPPTSQPPNSMNRPRFDAAAV